MRTGKKERLRLSGAERSLRMSEHMEKETTCACSCGAWRNRVIGIAVFVAALVAGAGFLTSGVFAGDGAEGTGTCSKSKAACPLSGGCGEKAKAASSEAEPAPSACCPAEKAKAASSETESGGSCCPAKAKAASSEGESAPACAPKSGCCADKAKAGSSEAESGCSPAGKTGACASDAPACSEKTSGESAT